MFILINDTEIKKFKSYMRAQSAIEYLTTYGWVLLAVILALTLLYIFTLSQATYPPGSCSFSIGFYCKDIVIGTNSITQQTKAGILLVNQQPYGMLNPAIYTSINGQNSTLQKCNPSYAAPGGSIICVINIPKNFTIGQLVAGGLYMKANYCGLSTNPGNISTCSSTPTQVYTGTFNTHTSVFQGNNEFSIIIKPNSPTWPVGSPGDAVYATVYFYGVPLAGATVQFTTPSTNVYINPSYATTVFGTGIATTYSYGTKKGTATITGIFGPVSNSTQITFYNSTNTGTTIPTTIPSIYYDLNMSTKPSNGGNISPGNNIYLNGSAVSISETPNSGYTFTGWSCIGIGCYAGSSPSSIIRITSNTTEVANFANTITIYSLTTNALPLNGGSVSPASGNYDAGNTVIISETPNSGYTFMGWTCSGVGCYSGTSSSNTITMNANIVETANFGIGLSQYNAPFVCATNQTYLYSINPTDSFAVTPEYNNLPMLDYLGGTYPHMSNQTSLSQINIYNNSIYNNGYIYLLSTYNSNYTGEKNFNYSISIINTSSFYVVSRIILNNNTLATKTLSSSYSPISTSLSLDSSGNLYININGNNDTHFVVIVNSSIINNVLQNYNNNYVIKPKVINLSKYVNTQSRLGLGFGSMLNFMAFGNYGYLYDPNFGGFLSNGNFTIFNLSNFNTIKVVSMPHNITNSYSNVNNMLSSGNYIYVATQNLTIQSSDITALNITNWKISNIKIGNFTSSNTEGIALSSNNSYVYALSSNGIVYEIATVNNIVIKTLNASYGGYNPSITNVQNNMLVSSNGTLLYLNHPTYWSGQNIGGITYYIIAQNFNLQTGNYQIINTTYLYPYIFGGSISQACASKRNNYNIYAISSGYYNGYGQGGRTINVLGTLYNQPKGIIQLPINDSASAIQIHNNTLIIAGGSYHNYSSTNIAVTANGFVATTNVFNGIVKNITWYIENAILFPSPTDPLSASTPVHMAIPPPLNLAYSDSTYFSLPNAQLFGSAAQVCPIGGNYNLGSGSQINGSGTSLGTVNLGCYLTGMTNVAVLAQENQNVYSATSPWSCGASDVMNLVSPRSSYIQGMVKKGGVIYVISMQEGSKLIGIDSLPRSEYYVIFGPSRSGTPSGQAIANYYFGSFNNTNYVSRIAKYSLSRDSGYYNLVDTSSFTPVSNCSAPTLPSAYTFNDTSFISATNANNVTISGPAVTSSKIPYIYMFNYTHNGGLAVFNNQTNLISYIKLPDFNISDYYGTNMVDPYLVLSNGSKYLFVLYTSGNIPNTCRIVVLSTINNNIIANQVTDGFCGNAVITPDNQFIYTDGSYADRGSSMYSVQALIHNSTYSVISGMQNGASSVITNLPLIHSQQLKYNYNYIEDTLYNNLAIYTNPTNESVSNTITPYNGTNTTSTTTTTTTSTTTTTTIAATTTIPPAGNITVTGPTSCPPGTVASGIEDAVSTFIGVGSGGSAVAYGSGYFSYSVVGTADGSAFSGVTSLSPNPITPLATGSNVILNVSTSNQTSNISKSFNGTNSSSLNKSLNKLTTELSQLKINNVVGTLSVPSNGTAYVYPSTLPISQSSYASEDTLVAQPYFCGNYNGIPQYCEGSGGFEGWGNCGGNGCSVIGSLSVCAPGGNTPQNNCTGYNFPGYPVLPFVSSQATTCVISVISPTAPNTTISGSNIFNPAFPVGYPCFMMNTYTQSNTGAMSGSISSSTGLTGTNNSVGYNANLQKYFVDQYAGGSPQATLNEFFNSYSDGAVAQACSGIDEIGVGLDAPPGGCMTVTLSTTGDSSTVSFSCPGNNNGVTSFCPPSYNVNLNAECYSPLTNNVTASTNTTCPIGTRKISTYMQIGPYSSDINNNGFNVAGFYQFYQAPTTYYPGPPSQDNGNYSSTQSMVDYGANLGMGLQQPSAGSGPTGIMYLPYKQVSNNGIISSVAYYPTGETNATCTLSPPSPCGWESVNGKKSGNIVPSGSGNIGIINVECTAIGTGSSSIKQINGYVPIKIKNNLNKPIKGPLQYPLVIDSATYGNNINKNWTNVEFTLNNTAESINVTPVYAWIESNASNSSTHTVVILNLSHGIAANSNVSVYMNFMTYNVMINTSSYTGEAPQLSPIYGEYDNGKKVFYYYNNFKNTTDLSGTSYTYPFTYANAISSDGLTINYDGYANYVYASPIITPSNNVTVDVSANMPAPTSTQFDEVGITPYSSPMSLYDNSYYANAGWVTSSRLGSSNAYPLFSNISTLYTVNTTTLAPLGQNVYSVGFSNINATNGTMYFSYDYGLQTQMRKYDYQYRAGQAIGMFNNQTGSVLHVNWVDMRAFIPPKSITSSIGPINTPT